jgi:hypothetical protein
MLPPYSPCPIMALYGPVLYLQDGTLWQCRGEGQIKTHKEKEVTGLVLAGRLRTLKFIPPLPDQKATPTSIIIPRTAVQESQVGRDPLQQKASAEGPSELWQDVGTLAFLPWLDGAVQGAGSSPRRAPLSLSFFF